MRQRPRVMLTDLFAQPTADDKVPARQQTADVCPVVNPAYLPAACCAHCGLPVSDASSVPAFCCAGCKLVFQALHGAGLGSYYEKREALPGRPALAAGERDEFAHFDDADFTNLYTRPLTSADLRQVDFFVEGVHCAACVWVLEKLPRLVPGVVKAELRFGESLLSVTWDTACVPLSAIAEQLTRLGYPPHPADARHDQALETAADRVLLARIGVAGAAFGNVMLLSVALYSAQYGGQTMGAEYATFFRWGSLVVTLPSVLWTAWPFFRGALGALRTRTAHMDLPVSIGICAALVWGTVSTLFRSGDIYFDSVTMLVFLLLVGRLIQTRQQRHARRASDLLLSLSPSTCRLVEGAERRAVPTHSVPIGALVEVRSGERIGVDGVVERGESQIDESLLTGESKPRHTLVGASVAAGTVNLSNPIHIRAEKTGRDTRLAQLIRDMEAVSARRAPVVLLADRLSARFVAIVLVLSGLTFALWLSQGLGIAVDRAVALLIVTCPCALGLATPLAAGVALGKAAKQGILVKGMSFLELIAEPGLVVFDKTGTLTSGKLSVVDGENLAHIAPYVRAAEGGSAHPIAHALLASLPVSAMPAAETTHETLGQGVFARVEGHDVWVGSARFVRAQCRVDTENVRAQSLLARGLSPVYVVVDGKLDAVLGLGDPLHADAQASLQALRTMGYSLAVLSGDRREVVQRVVAECAVDFEVVLTEQSPEQKLAFIEQQNRQRAVYMVGDGVNDAAALSAARVGIAVCGGAEASLAAADIFATRRGLAPVADVIRGARLTLRVIKRNLCFSLGYNAVAAVLAMTGVINPLLAAILMPLSSLTVVTNSFRSHTFQGPS